MILALLLTIWDRPWVTAKCIGDYPYGLGGGAELFVHNELSIGADGNVSPAGVLVRASVTYWPRVNVGATHHQFLFGVGADAGVLFSSIGRGYLVMPLAADFRYLARPWEAFGFILGARLGIGVAFPTPHFAFSFVSYVGFAFGAR